MNDLFLPPGSQSAPSLRCILILIHHSSYFSLFMKSFVLLRGEGAVSKWEPPPQQTAHCETTSSLIALVSYSSRCLRSADLRLRHPLRPSFLEFLPGMEDLFILWVSGMNVSVTRKSMGMAPCISGLFFSVWGFALEIAFSLSPNTPSVNLVRRVFSETKTT